MAKEKVFPNLCQALIVILCCTATYLIIYSITTVFVYNQDGSSFSHVVQVIALALNFVPYIVYLKSKTEIHLRDFLALPSWKTLFKVIIISLLVRFVITVPFDKPIEFFRQLQDYSLRYYALSLQTTIPLLAVGLKWLLIPLVEELLFRGLILRQFLKQFSPAMAIFMTSLIFSVYHVNLAWIVALFIHGLVLGIIYYKTNSVLVSTISHYILYNGLLIYDHLELNTETLFFYILIVVISIIIVVFLLQRSMDTIELRKTIRKDY